MIVSIIMMIVIVCVSSFIAFLVFKRKVLKPYVIDERHSESTNDIMEANAPEADIIQPFASNGTEDNTLDPFLLEPGEDDI